MGGGRGRRGGALSLWRVLRPGDWSELVGPCSLSRLDSPLHGLLEEIRRGGCPSVVLWGPPGTGKTTIAHLLAEEYGYPVVRLEPGKSVARVLHSVSATVVLLVEEIHHLARNQQDLLLLPIEEGRLVLVGTTTENPGVTLRAPLLSRVRVVEVPPLSASDLSVILDRALRYLREEKGMVLDLDEEERARLIRYAWGDARRLLQMVESLVVGGARGVSVRNRLRQQVSWGGIPHSRSGDDRYLLISALIKSIRGSDPQGAVYWLARLVSAREDPLYLARRLLISASEDVGLADPFALVLASACYQACSVVGYPECSWFLSETAIYLALAPKSNSAYRALNRAVEAVGRRGPLPVPMHLRNPVTEWHRLAGWGAAYENPHGNPWHLTAQRFLPEELEGERFYEPVLVGAERGLWLRFLRLREAFWSYLQQVEGEEKCKGSDGKSNRDGSGSGSSSVASGD